MKSNKRIKKINGKEYWYEDIPYYDTEKKQIRHHSKYLGRNVNGEPVRIRNVMNASSLVLPSPSFTSYNYGELLPVLQIIEELHIDRFLGDMLNMRQRNMVLSLCVNRVVRPMALHLVGTWYDASFLSVLYPDLSLSSQNVSRLLSDIGDSDIPFLFMGKLLKSVGTKSTLLYDITSLSSHSRLMNLLEYGYSRDDPDLPQLNLSMIVDKQLGIPVMYDVYPGSIVDVSTLKNTVRKIESFGVKDFTLILDRGFFSMENLQELVDDALVSFVIPASFSSKKVKELMSQVKNDIDHPKYLCKFNKEPLFVKPVSFTLENNRMVKGYCYYDPGREQQERNSFYNRLYDMKKQIEEKKIFSWMKPALVFKQRAGMLQQYYSWRVKDHYFKVNIRKNAVMQRLNRMGKFILFYQGDVDWKNCLTSYRQKDSIEKGFKRFKHDLNGIPLNTQKESTTKGFLFICFIGLIIQMRLVDQMKKSDLLEDYTVEKLFLELEKMKKIRLANNEYIVSELTKKQKYILEKLDLCA
jgi:transposase